MSTYDELLAGVRAFTLAAIEKTAADEVVIYAESPGTRPSLPYLTIKILADGVDVESRSTTTVDDGSGGSIERTTSVERATISIQGYGRDTFGWLQILRSRTDNPRYMRYASDLGVTILEPSGVLDVSSELDTQIERRWSLDLLVAHCVVTETAEQPGESLAAITADVTQTLESGTAAPDVTHTTTHDLTGAP